MIGLLIKWLQSVFTQQTEQKQTNSAGNAVQSRNVPSSRLTKPWHLSDQGMQFIIGWEKYSSHLYDTDVAGNRGNATIGYGHLVHLGPISGDPSEAPFKKGITEPQARELLKADLAKTEAIVNQYVQVPLFQYEYDALVDFIYNLGDNGLQVFDTVNQGQYGAVGDRIKLYNQAGHQYSAGLAKRREAEVSLFDHGIYDASH